MFPSYGKMANGEMSPSPYVSQKHVIVRRSLGGEHLHPPQRLGHREKLPLPTHFPLIQTGSWIFNEKKNSLEKKSIVIKQKKKFLPDRETYHPFSK